MMTRTLKPERLTLQAPSDGDYDYFTTIELPGPRFIHVKIDWFRWWVGTILDAPIELAEPLILSDGDDLTEADVIDMQREARRLMDVRAVEEKSKMGATQ